MKVVKFGRKWPNIFKKNFGESFNIIVFKKKFFFKKVAQLQKYWFWAKFGLFSAIFHVLASDPHIILGNIQFFSENFLVCL